MILLASASPRRRDLLAAAGIAFEVLPADVDEAMRESEAPKAYVKRVAREKSYAALRPLLGGRGTLGAYTHVVAADTIVELDGIVLHKPGSDANAVATLRALAGREHLVRTAVSVICLTGHPTTGTAIEQNDEIVVTTRIRFRPYDEATIARYVATGEPLDRAGAYAIQGGGMALVDRIVGSYTNVVGLPLRETLELLT